jgi:glycosyltransferase involved in cell wall biosynthesis
MKIVVVTQCYSEGMGYTENCLPKALAARGHEVHVVSSSYNVYGNAPDYAVTYESFLGPADQGEGKSQTDGYTVHRLSSRFLGGYIFTARLGPLVHQLRPDVVHSLAIASFQTFQLAALQPLLGYALFTETHQHLSVVKPYLKGPGARSKKIAYWLTRTLPTKLASVAAEKCYAIAPDCLEVATMYYGVPRRKMVLQSLSSDTELFRPAATAADLERRCRMRAELGYGQDDVIAVYSGRLADEKNPLLLAQAVRALSGATIKALFIGEGPQKKAIQSLNSRVIPFVRYPMLADLYRMADIGVWPRQESMSMLDASATGLPLIVSDRMGDPERVRGCGLTYHENDAWDLAGVLDRLRVADERRALGEAGRARIMQGFSWSARAQSIERDYIAAGAGH